MPKQRKAKEPTFIELCEEYIETNEVLSTRLARAGRIALCILTGMPEPARQPDDDEEELIMMVAEEIATLLTKCSKEDYVRRLPRALAWATRDNVPPDMGILAVERPRAARSKLLHKQIERTPAWKTYYEKLGFIYNDATA